MNKYSKENIIYLAGIIDGEGCVKPRKNFQRCEVSNTSKELIDWLFDNFGGHKIPVKREGNRKLQYRWILRKEEMKNIFPLIIPYMIIKKSEAEQSLKLAKKIYVPPFLGKHHTKETKKKIIEGIKECWKNKKFMKLKKESGLL